MDVALTLLILWGLLFLPIGLVLQWLVLGEGARVRALPLAPVTGIALAVVVLAALGRVGVDITSPVVSWSFVAVSAVCAVLIWRLGVPWRSRELIGSTLLLLLAVVLVQMPVIGGAGDGPLGYGTPADPVEEVAAIDAAAHGPSSRLEVAREASRTADERPIGFEQFAAMTVALGRGSGDAVAESGWSAYSLHAAITGMLVALVSLPLFAFARARGVRWFGLVVLVPLGVLAPWSFLALANGAGAAVAAIPFTAAGAFSLLVTRRDRGWWALAVLFGAAIAAVAGPIGLLPLVSIGGAWMLLRSDTYEHLSQHDAPRSRTRSLGLACAFAALGAIAVAPTLVGGTLLAWTRLHDSLVGAALSWPFAWLDTDLTSAGPESALEVAIWLVGPALLAVAAIYAFVRNERRELGVLVGIVVAIAFALVVGVADEDAGTKLLEYVLLVTSPLLAALAVRAVAIAREHEPEDTRVLDGRLSGVGPTLLVGAFGLLAIAATSVTGTRMVHAPTLDDVKMEGTSLIAAGDPWLSFVVDGERASGGYADADSISGAHPDQSRRSITYGGYDNLILGSSPLASDPTLRYVEQSDLDGYQARLFVDRRSESGASRDVLVDSDLLRQRARRATDTDTDTDTDGAATGSSIAGSSVAGAVPARHDPVEGPDAAVAPDRPAGLLVPETDIERCSVENDVIALGPCKPAEPVVGPGCTSTDVRAVRTRLPAEQAAGRQPDPDVQTLTIDSDSLTPLRPPLLGVQCFDVEVGGDSRALVVHLRDVGIVLGPEQAAASPAGAWTSERDESRIGGAGELQGGVRRETSEQGATLTYGAGRLFGRYDLVLEGSFGAGVSVGGGYGTSPESGVESGDGFEAPVELPIATIRGSANGFSQVMRDSQLQGSVVVRNENGTDIALGRLFARPRDLPRACDVPIAIAPGELREIRLSSPDPESNGTIERPGITVAVVDAAGAGSSRTAHVAVGTYLVRGGLPRHLLVDWTEQFEEAVTVEACDGTDRVERGAQPPADPATDDVTLSTQALDAFGEQQGLDDG